MKITEFQRKTYNKTIDHITAFIPDDGITGADLLNVIEHCVKTMPDNELDALFDMSERGYIRRHELFNRDKKEVAVGGALLSIIVKAMHDGEVPGKMGADDDKAGEDRGNSGEDRSKTEADDAESE